MGWLHVVLLVFSALVVSAQVDNKTETVSRDLVDNVTKVLDGSTLDNATEMVVGDTTTMAPTDASFEVIEKKMKDAVGQGVRKLLPYLLQGGSGAQISGPCASSVMRVIGGIRQMREWAFRFMDAAGKIPPGILDGTSLSVGDYDECLDIEVGKRDTPPTKPSEVVFRGKYCLLEMHRPKGIQKAIDEYHAGNKDIPIAKTKTSTEKAILEYANGHGTSYSIIFLNMFVRYKHLGNSTFKFGVCLPSKCSDDDLQKILNSDSIKSIIKITVSHCEVKEDMEISKEQVVIMCLFGFITGIMVLGTVIDMVMRCRKTQQDTNGKQCKKNTLIEIISGTSLYSNALKVFDNTKCIEPIRCLCAIRPITVILTIYSHAYGHIHELHFQKFSKAANFLKFFDSFTFAGVANGSVGMDTIIFIAGLTISYSRWRNVPAKGKVKLNLISLLLQRYCRMSLAQLLVVCVMLLFPLLGSGPIWADYVGPILNNCHQRWWLHLLYVQNFWRSPEVCLYHTWVLAVIMQLTVISVVILLILRRSAFFGALFMIGLVLAGIVGVAVVTIVNDLPGSMAFFMLDVRTGPITWRDVYTLAYDHVGSFCIGIFTGYFLATRKDKLHVNKPCLVLLWCIAIVFNTSVLFGLYSYRNGDRMLTSLSTFYAVMHRNVWSAGIAWLVIACTTRHAGAVARVLHSNLFLPLDRLCYMAFLVHIPIMYFHSGSLRERWYMGHLELMFLAIGYIVTSFLSAFVLQVIFVQPYFYVENVITSRFASRVKLSFEKCDRTMSLPTVASSTSESGSDPDGCINGAYSKKLDGL